uniref:Uncharacterized protein n=1 Tax=Lotus japonicus TaxID=34305 RepID=I3SMQ9_LOTJA|nr:unknown [Lotus japonicus]
MVLTFQMHKACKPFRNGIWLKICKEYWNTRQDILNFKVLEILHCTFLRVLEATQLKYTTLALKAKLLS